MASDKGLTELLVRLGVKPTHNRAVDIELAKDAMSKPFNGSKGLSRPYREQTKDKK